MIRPPLDHCLFGELTICLALWSWSLHVKGMLKTAMRGNCKENEFLFSPLPLPEFSRVSGCIDFVIQLAVLTQDPSFQVGVGFPKYVLQNRRS